MKAAIISDIHDHIKNLEHILNEIKDNTACLIICGDICAPFVINILGDIYTNTIHAVFGNNDGDRFNILKKAYSYNHINIHGEYFVGKIDKRLFMVNHYPYLADIADSDYFDIICYGHNHKPCIYRNNNTLIVNPGSVMGYIPENKEFVDPSFIIVDTDTLSARIFNLKEINNKITICAT